TKKIDHKVLQSRWNDLIASNSVSSTPRSAAGLLAKSRDLERKGILTQEIATQPVAVEPQLEPQVREEEGGVMETEVEAEVARVEITQPEILAEVAPVEGELVPNDVEAEQAETFRLEFEKVFKEARRIEKRVPLKLVRDTRIPQKYLEYGESAISEVVRGNPDMETLNCAVYSAALAIQHMVL
uniref:Uncharacterized protein n=1 Tax=Romanomermis culicivorax TaxID=13658 RepID=A0A915ILY1_ROMCU